MFSDARDHVIAAISGAPIVEDPFPHICVSKVFPPDFYALMISNLPGEESYDRLVDTGRVSRSYSPERLGLFPTEENLQALPTEQAAFWRGLFDVLLDSVFADAVFARFETQIVDRFQSMAPEGQQLEFKIGFESFLIRDRRAYSLGPHTDAFRKLVSMLFYLPADGNRPELGTTLYRPLDPERRCVGGPHYEFAEFEEVVTMPYRPNTLVAFPKSYRCFHGVKPVDAGGAWRDILFYDVHLV